MNPTDPKAAELTDRERACWEQHWSGKISWLLSYDDAVRYITAERKLQAAERKLREAEQEIAQLGKLLAFHTNARVVKLQDEQQPEQVGPAGVSGGRNHEGERSSAGAA